MIKKFTIVITLIILTGCGFTPMYSKKNNNNNFSIEEINFSGERELNNFLKIGLMRYQNSSDKKFSIDVESEFSKIIFQVRHCIDVFTESHTACASDSIGYCHDQRRRMEIRFYVYPEQSRCSVFCFICYWVFSEYVPRRQF